uniref:Mucin-5AC-like n=1 Tax=Petromyzon marinus TaxID=7757 RepID=A0AAJ7UJ98_PETMA|nr:mucin-5AC-like [Petromyzon marinus]
MSHRLSVRCEPGCGCPRGLLADGVGGCVAPRDCPCSRNGRSYSSGGTVTTKCEKCLPFRLIRTHTRTHVHTPTHTRRWRGGDLCLLLSCVRASVCPSTCRGGQWACQARRQEPCLSTCSVFGDGHYSSFDGRQFVLDGSCEFVVAQDYCGDQQQQQGTFRVITENLPCGTSGTTCSRAVRIILEDVEIYLHDGNYSASRVGPAASPERRHTVVSRGLYLVVSTAVGLTLTWDRRTSLTLSLPPSYQVGGGGGAGVGGVGVGRREIGGRVCGLCGNNNGDVSDDFVGRDGARVASPTALARGWRAAPSTALVAMDPCRANPYRQVWAQRRCAVIGGDAFAECHAQVYHVPYLEACVRDACACDGGGDCECVCTAVAAYARACRDHGVCVHWRTPDMCPVFCDFYNEEGECTWHYSACSALSAICPTAPGGNLSSELNTLEGCYPRCVKARPYWDEESHRCVALRECPCYVDGVRLAHNATNVIVATTTTCDCVSGVPQCRDLAATTPVAPTSSAAQVSSASPTKPDSEHSSASPTKPDSEHSSASPTKPDSEHSSASPTKPDVAHTTLSTSPSPVSGTAAASTTVRKTSTELTVKPAEWSPWLNVSVPTPDNEGDVETIERIRNAGVDVCPEPVGVQCRAVMYPGRDVSTLGQKVICDRLVGLICRNADQSGPRPLCLDYAVKFLCAPATGPTTTMRPTAATSSVAPGVSLSSVPTPPWEANSTEPDIKPAEWTRWFDVSAPTPDNEGDIETIQKVRNAGVGVCSEPVGVQCQAVMYPGRDVSTLGQKVICDRLVGLICRNADQSGPRPLCLNYAVKFLCAPATRPTTTTTTMMTTVATSSIAPPVSLKSASSPTPADSPNVRCIVSSVSRSPEAPGLTKTTTTVAGPTPAASTELTVKPAEWSPWLNVSTPTPDNEGDVETIERIRNAGVDVCPEPMAVQCQAVMYPGRDVSTLGQKVICDRLVGLICRNADQSGSRPLCLDYAVKFLCAPATGPTTTMRPTAATSSVAPGVSLSSVPTPPWEANSTEPDIKPAEWTRWFDVSAPTPDNEGDIETIQKVRNAGVGVCSEPVGVQCQAVMYPGRDVATLGQKVICDRLVGLICRNADQSGPRPLCLNYAVKFLCAPRTRPTTMTTTTMTTVATSSIAPPVSLKSASSPTPADRSPEAPGLTKTTTTVAGPTPAASTELTVKPAEWSPWLNVSTPTPDNEGDVETIERIRNAGVDVCPEPVAVQCRAVMYPGRDVSTLGQKVICDRLVGLICRNADQSGPRPLCLDYAVKFLCAPATGPTTTMRPTAATSSVAPGVSLSSVPTPPWEANSTEPDIKPAEWTRWFDVSAPTPDNEGDIETIQKVRNAGVGVCSEPVGVQCQAVMYPGRDVSTLGQKVICDRLVGLICRNADQSGPRPLCLNYAVRFLCGAKSNITAATTTPPPPPGTPAGLFTKRSCARDWRRWLRATVAVLRYPLHYYTLQVIPDLCLRRPSAATTTLSPATVCKEEERPVTACVSLFVHSCTGAQRVVVTKSCDWSASECHKHGSFPVATTRPGECCPHYQCVCPEDCAVPACSPGSVLMELMESSAQNSCCRSYECVPQPSPTCEYNGKMYQVGEQWNKDNCSFLECTESQGSALLREHQITCLEPQYPHTCTNVSVVYDVHGCCITYKCNDAAPQESCQPQNFWTVISVGDCSSKGPVEVTKCVGTCFSSTL